MISRFRIIFLLFSLLFLIALLRLYNMQVREGDYYRKLSENNRIRIKRLKAPRGNVYDYRGILLAGNQPSFNLYVVKEDLYAGDPEETLKRVSQILPVSLEDIEKRLRKYRYAPPFLPIPIAKDIGKEKAIYIGTNSDDFQGIEVIPSLKRFYPSGVFFSHVIGYLGEVSERDLKKGYYPGDMVGKDGIERTMECYLRGRDGGMEVEVNASGRKIRILGVVEPVRGNDIYLTIDKGLQKLCYELMRGKAGAIVVMNPKTGRIYALYSSPSFNPNWFSTGIDVRRWRDLLRNPLKPLNNRAISCFYAPGSTFKVVVALAALSEGAVDSRTRFFCGGSLFFKGRYYRCWKKYGHGDVDILKAIEESCDVYFYNLGIKLDVDTIARYAKGLGLGEKTGLELPGEKKGIVPSKDWKKRVIGERWYKGETLSLSIGQGYISVTPIQQAVLFSAILNGGRVLKPFIVDKIVDQNGRVVFKGRGVVRRIFHLKKEFVDLVKKGMLLAVEGEHGTGRKARIKGYKVAGKTGTAQVVKLKKRMENQKDIPYRFRDHAWFVAFAPYDDPRFVVVVLVEHGGHGGDVAAPIAREVLKYALCNL